MRTENNPQKGVILYLKFLRHFQSYSNSKKSKNTPDWELKELFFRSKIDHKLGVKITPHIEELNNPKKGVILYLKFLRHFQS